VVYNANAIPIPWIRPAWPRVARHFTRLATAEAQGAGTSHDSKEWTSPPRGLGLRSTSLAHSRAHAASRQTNEERRPLKRETRQWIVLDKHHQAAGPELDDQHHSRIVEGWHAKRCPPCTPLATTALETIHTCTRHEYTPCIETRGSHLYTVPVNCSQQCARPRSLRRGGVHCVG